MKTLTNMKEISDTKFPCEFCKASFAKERTLISHLCERKKRWLDKDQAGNRIGYQTFVQYYTKHVLQASNKKIKTLEDFIYSPYYKLFVKFGNYCVDVKCLNISRYIEWLLHNGIKHDDWISDSVYTKFIISYLKTEDPYDAVTRTIKYCMDLATESNIQDNDCLRYLNSNKLCYSISLGKISPWVLYCSESGVKFLSQLNDSQQQMIMDYIDPQHWAVKLKRDKETAEDITKLLKEAKW